MSNVVVIGGGIAGLVAALEARRGGADVTLLEARDRPGGVIVTEQTHGCLVEGGPDGFLDGNADLPALCAELGIGDQLVPQSRREVLLCEHGRLEPLPPGKAAAVLELATDETAASRAFLTLRDGMGSLTAAIARRLGDVIRTGTRVMRLSRAGSGIAVTVAGGDTIEPDAIVLAVPSAAASRLTRDLDGDLSLLLAEQEMVSTATVSLGFARSLVKHPLEASGFVAPRRAHPGVVACTFASSKFPGRAPQGTVLLRAHVGRYGRTELLDLDDDALVRAALDELTPILGLSGSARFARVHRWPLALPRADQSRGGRLAAIGERAAGVSLLTAGAAFGDVGLSACVRSGRAAGRAATRGSLVA